MKTKIQPGLLALTIAIPLLVGGLSAFITQDMMKEYFFLNKPPLSPPGWVFPVVWTILYILMGMASYMVIKSGADSSLISKAMIFYGIQLILNFIWSILFFKYSFYLLAFAELIAMMAAIIASTIMFFKTNRTAGLLMTPYILWTTFAAYLNLAVYNLSKTQLPMPR